MVISLSRQFASTLAKIFHSHPSSELARVLGRSNCFFCSLGWVRFWQRQTDTAARIQQNDMDHFPDVEHKVFTFFPMPHRFSLRTLSFHCVRSCAAFFSYLRRDITIFNYAKNVHVLQRNFCCDRFLVDCCWRCSFVPPVFAFWAMRCVCISCASNRYHSMATEWSESKIKSSKK